MTAVNSATPLLRPLNLTHGNENSTVPESAAKQPNPRQFRAQGRQVKAAAKGLSGMIAMVETGPQFQGHLHPQNGGPHVGR